MAESVAPKKKRMFSDFSRDSVTLPNGAKMSVPGRLEFTASSLDPAMLSAIRRSIMSFVHTMAFRFDSVSPDKQDVKIAINTGNLHNEFIGERIGLIPFCLSRSQTIDIDPKKWRFELLVENKTTTPLDVTSKDLVPVYVGEDDPPVTPSFFKPDPISKDHCLITVLMPGQKLSLSATPTLGTGDEHCRFSPVAACCFTPVTDPIKAKAEREKAEDKGTFDALQAPRIYETDAAGLPVAHRFQLESQCGMKPEDIVTAGVEALASRLRSASTRKDSVKDAKEQALSGGDVKSFAISGEDHTVGALLQNAMLEDYEFAGYFTPHILEKEIVLRVKRSEANKPLPEAGDIRDYLDKIAIDCENILDQWKTDISRS